MKFRKDKVLDAVIKTQNGQIKVKPEEWSELRTVFPDLPDWNKLQLMNCVSVVMR